MTTNIKVQIADSQTLPFAGNRRFIFQDQLKIAAIIIGIAIAILFTYFPLPLSPAVTQNPDPHEGMSFIIFKNATSTYAKNAQTGVIDYSSTNSSSVINNAIMASPAAGGKIVFDPSTSYTLTAPIVVNNARIMFDLSGAKIKSPSNNYA